MVTGFDIYTDRKIMYMRFSAGVGSVAVADRERPDVHCAACHAVLPWTAAELRAA